MTPRPSLPRLPRREPDAHKGDAGRVLVIAGSVGYTGAAWLAAKAALRAGAGIVVTACPDRVFPILATKHSAVMVRPFPSTDSGGLALAAFEPILELARGFDALAVGPGLGRDASTLELARRLALRLGPEARLVLDADGLNAFEGRVERLREVRAQLVLTPHPGELARLVGTTTDEIEKDRLAAVRRFVKDKGEVLVLKGKGTLVGERHEGGVRTHENASGNAGMATAGSGDVLTGVVGALLAGGLSAWDAARLGVHVHGRAGDRARAARIHAAGLPPGTDVPVPLTATEILDEVPNAIAERLHLDEVDRALAHGGPGGRS